jgi:hypothetical protein
VFDDALTLTLSQGEREGEMTLSQGRRDDPLPWERGHGLADGDSLVAMLH